MKKSRELKGHQGDVQFRQITSLPEGALPIKRKPLALGETSGHAHCLTGEEVDYYEFEGDIFAVVGESGAALQHVQESSVTEKNWKSKELMPKQDHEPHILPKGTYRFFVQNEYNPYTKLMEKTLD